MFPEPDSRDRTKAGFLVPDYLVDRDLRGLVHFLLSLYERAQWEVRLPFFGTNRLHQ